MKNTPLGFIAALVTGIIAAGCVGDGGANYDVGDLIIRGKAQEAAELCNYPLRINITPSPEIQNKEDFIKWFPVVFDKESREELRKLRDAGNGWSDYTWRGCSFGNGLLWCDYFPPISGIMQLFVLNLVSPSLFKWWEMEFQKGLMTLSPEYREDCVWPAYYFMSEDEEYFGRVDALGEENAWTNDGSNYSFSKISNRFRVMLFRRGQKTSDDPWMVFNYDAKDDPKFNKRYASEIECEKEDFVFSKFTYGNDETPEMMLEYGKRTGMEAAIRLKHCTWPPPNAANN